MRKIVYAPAAHKEFPATFTMKDSDTVSKAAPTPAIDDRRVYVFFESGDLFAFDHKGSLQWRRKLAEEYGSYKTNHGLGSSIALTDKAVITLVARSGPSYLLAVDKQTGENLSKADLKPGGGWSSPAVTTHQNRQQILISISGGVTAYDAVNGEQLWSGCKPKRMFHRGTTDGNRFAAREGGRIVRSDQRR